MNSYSQVITAGRSHDLMVQLLPSSRRCVLR